LTENLGNQFALVTGASGGIGGAIATELVLRGATVCVVGRAMKKLAVLVSQLGTRAIPIPADLTDDNSIDKLTDQIEKQFGRLDILVHSAGVIAHETLVTAPVEALDDQYKANVRGPYRLTQQLIPLLRRPRGQIVFVNSSTGLTASPAAGQFSMTQHAFKAMADALRSNVNGDGIKVMSIYPGRTATPRIEALARKEGRNYRPESLLQPVDIASVVINALSLPWTAEVTDIQIRPMLNTHWL
jgi:NADP-dependent 3-hydroxy acid dehydrogenase YdfG